MWRKLLEVAVPPPTPTSGVDFHMSLPMQVIFTDIVTLGAAAVIISIALGIQGYLHQRKIVCICGHKERDHSPEVNEVSLIIRIAECRLCKCRRYIADLRLQR